MSADLSPDLLIEEHVWFPSGAFRLEGVLAYAAGPTCAGTVVVAGPHPYLGGDMDNNVVRALARGLAERGWTTLRFNYRGQGASEGPPLDVNAQMAVFWQTSQAPGDADLADDLVAAGRFLTRAAGAAHRPHHLAAYSFGCWLASRVADQPPRPVSLVLVSPPVTRHDFSRLASVRQPKLVVAADNDFACQTPALQEAMASMPEPKRLVTFPTAEHFFKGMESVLVDRVSDFLEEAAGG